MQALTPLRVDQAAPKKDKRYEISDTVVPGLRLLVQTTGAKSYALRYRFNHKKQKLTLGSHPGLTLAAAREAARKALGDVAKGIDPNAVKRDGSPEDITVKTAADQYVVQHVERNMRDETAKYWKRETEAFAQEFPARSMRSIRRREIMEQLDKAAERGPHAKAQVLKVLRQFFSYALEREWVDANPTDAIKKDKHDERERYLDPKELCALWQACEAVGNGAGSLCKLLILTGARRDEIRGLRWDEIGDEWIIIPPGRTKTEITHKIAVTPQVKRVLDAIPRRGEFVLGVKAPMSNADRSKKALDAALAEPFAEAWTLHDLRRTFSSLGVAECEIDPFIAEKCLGHKLKGTQKIYQRHEFLKQCKAAWEAWGNYVEKLVGENVRKLVA